VLELLAFKYNFGLKLIMSKPKLKNALKSRSSIRWKDHDYGSAGFYFITLCCQNRLRWMGEVKEGKMKLNPIGEIVAQEWQATYKKRSNVQLHEYVIMPDHIHGIIEIKFPIQSPKGDEKFCSPKNTIGSIIRGFKSATTVRVLDCISNHEMHWCRGELTFAPNACDEVSAAHTSELTFTPKQSDKASDADQLKFANHESQTRRGELIFAPDKPNLAFDVDTSELTFAPKHPENQPCKLQIKSAPFKLWQRGYFDRVIRTQDELIAVKKYIKANPLRWACKMNEV
jgi:putative transposase